MMGQETWRAASRGTDSGSGGFRLVTLTRSFGEYEAVLRLASGGRRSRRILRAIDRTITEILFEAYL